MNNSSTDAMTLSPIIGFFYIGLLIFYLITMWKIFTKAGKPGWACLIPIYSYYVFMKIIGRPGWWLLLYLIPFANIVVSIINVFDLAKVFGRSGLFGFFALLLFPYIGYPILAFGNSKYRGANATPQQPHQTA